MFALYISDSYSSFILLLLLLLLLLSLLLLLFFLLLFFLLLFFLLLFFISGILDHIWDATDRDGSGTIDKDEYIIMCRKVYRAIVDDTDSQEAHDEITRIAEEDWDADRQGHDHLNYARFTRAWFQLADHWTHDLNPESYESFLSNIFTTLTDRDANGHIVWRDDNQIHHYDPEATDEQQEEVIVAGFTDKEVSKPKRRKKISGGMSAEEMEKYRLRMAAKKAKSRGGNVVVVQEGEFDRNIKLAKISSRNGLYIGSVVPPPDSWDDVHTHKAIHQSAFMRINVKGGPGVFSRGYNSDAESVALAGHGLVEAYPQELKNSLSRSKIPPVLSEEAKASTAYLLQRLWASSPVGGTSRERPAGSPGGPSGWLTKFVRSDAIDPEDEEKIEQMTRQVSGVGGGFGGGGEDEAEGQQKVAHIPRPQSAAPGGRPTRERRNNQESSSRRSGGGRSRKSSRRSSSSNLSSEYGDSRPMSAPAQRKSSTSNLSSLPTAGSSNKVLLGGGSITSSLSTNSLEVEKIVEATAESFMVRPTSSSNLLAKEENKATPVATTPADSTTPADPANSTTLPKNNVKRQKKRRPKSAAASRSRIGQRRGKKSSSLAQFKTNDNVPETDFEFGVKKKKLKRPKSAMSKLRNSRQTLDGSHMFSTKSREKLSETHAETLAKTLAKTLTQEMQQEDAIEVTGKKKKKKKRPKSAISQFQHKKQVVPKVTLLRLNENCQRADVAGVLKAMGVDDTGVDIRMTIVNPMTRQRKARVYFRKSYVDYKLAVSMLSIVQRSVDVTGTTPIFARINVDMSGAAAPAGQKDKGSRSGRGGVGGGGGRQKEPGAAVSKIRVPKIMRPLSATR